MAEWPVALKTAPEDVRRGVVEPGDEVAATWANISGDPRAAIWIICPRYGPHSKFARAAVHPPTR